MTNGCFQISEWWYVEGRYDLFCEVIKSRVRTDELKAIVRPVTEVIPKQVLTENTEDNLTMSSTKIEWIKRWPPKH